MNASKLMYGLGTTVLIGVAAAVLYFDSPNDSRKDRTDSLRPYFPQIEVTSPDRNSINDYICHGISQSVIIIDDLILRDDSTVKDAFVVYAREALNLADAPADFYPKISLTCNNNGDKNEY